MRCCPMCYSKAYLKNTGSMTCGATIRLNYEISCCNADWVQLKLVWS